MQKDGSSGLIYLQFKDSSSMQVGYHPGLSFEKKIIVAKTFSLYHLSDKCTCWRPKGKSGNKLNWSKVTQF